MAAEDRRGAGLDGPRSGTGGRPGGRRSEERAATGPDAPAERTGGARPDQERELRRMALLHRRDLEVSLARRRPGVGPMTGLP